MFVAPRAFGGSGNLFSPLVFLGLGAVLIERMRRIAVCAAGSFALLYLSWFFSLQNPRLLLPSVLPLAILVAGTFEHWLAGGRRLLSTALAGAAVVGLAPALLVVLLPAWRYIHLGEDQYLRARAPFYDDVRRIDAALAPDARVLSLASSFFTPRHSWLAASPYIQSEIPPEELIAGRLLETLRRHHITHVYGTARTLQDQPWAAASGAWRLVWRNPKSCACGQRLLSSGPVLETALFALTPP
jgi:hypothetical protein